MSEFPKAPSLTSEFLNSGGENVSWLRHSTTRLDSYADQIGLEERDLEAQPWDPSQEPIADGLHRWKSPESRTMFITKDGKSTAEISFLNLTLDIALVSFRNGDLPAHDNPDEELPWIPRLRTSILVLSESMITGSRQYRDPNSQSLGPLSDRMSTRAIIDESTEILKTFKAALDDYQAKAEERGDSRLQNGTTMPSFYLLGQIIETKSTN